MIIQLRALNGTGGGREDNCLDGVAIIQFRAWNGTGRGGEDDCLHDSVMIQLSALGRRR